MGNLLRDTWSRRCFPQDISFHHLASNGHREKGRKSVKMCHAWAKKNEQNGRAPEFFSRSSDICQNRFCKSLSLMDLQYSNAYADKSLKAGFPALSGALPGMNVAE